MELLWQSVLLALGLIASLSLFLSLKRELHALGRKQRKEMETPAASRPPTARAGFTPARRTQAVRLLHQGEDAAHIAAALGVPCREVELLIRVQRMVAEHAPPPAAHATPP